MHKISLALQDFFFEAARATYAGVATKQTIPDLPLSKVYKYQRPGFLYIDTYFTNGEQSGGQTIIYIKPESETLFVPAWIMQYHGWCKSDDKTTLAYLKAVLSDAYQERIFYGGRGRLRDESQLKVHEMMYLNKWIGTFDYFSGEEEILSTAQSPREEIIPSSERVFWHHYQGMTLMPEVQLD